MTAAGGMDISISLARSEDYPVIAAIINAADRALKELDDKYSATVAEDLTVTTLVVIISCAVCIVSLL